MDDANGMPQTGTEPGEPQPAEAAGRKRNGRSEGGRSEGGSGRTPEARTIGSALKQAREAAGLTLAQVAERTKVRPGILTQIEADAHDQLPALTYSIGFVKAYARTVGLDPIAAAERYRLESQKGDPVPTMIDLQPLEEQRLPSRGLVVGTVAALVLLIGGFWAWGAGWLAPGAPAAPAPVRDEGAATDPDPAGPADALAPPPAPIAAGGAVVLTATEEVWLRIADGQESFFMGTMAKGQTLTLPPGRAWTLRTGRAGALQVKVGGTAVRPLGGPAEQVRNLSLKPADLLGRPEAAAGGLQPTRLIDAPAAPQGPPPSSLDRPVASPPPAG
ncbi:MAG: helix-turn-helix domain-containing protein [Sandaracinobacteroides sp.]